MATLRRMLLPSMALLLACSGVVLTTHAQTAPAGGATAAPDSGNKAGKPPTDAAASQAGVATKKPSKQGTQSGSPAASAPGSSSADKAAKPPTDEAASRAGVATKKPAKPGAQSGPSASAPK